MAAADTMVVAAFTAAEVTTAVAVSLVADQSTVGAVATVEGAQLAADRLAVASEAAPHLGALPGVASKVVAGFTEEAASMVAEVPAVEAAHTVEDTGKQNIF